MSRFLQRLAFGGGQLWSMLTGTPLAPVFNALPSIAGTPQVGQALTGIDGAITGGTAVSRRWLLGAAVVSTAQTFLPTAAGALVYEVTATGPGGTTVALSAAVTVLPALATKNLRRIGPIGMNIAGDQFGGALPCQLLDHAKVGSPWSAGNGGVLTLTPLGHPASCTTYAERLVPVDGVRAKPGRAQRYVLRTSKKTWRIGIEGAGTNGGATVSDETDENGLRRIVFDVDNSHLEVGGSALRFYVFDLAGSPFVDGTDFWQVVRIDKEDALVAGRYFDDEFIASCKTYGYIRTMDVGNALSAHNGGKAKFSDITPLGKAVWDTGFPLEVLVAAAIEADVHLWHSFSFAANDDRVAREAAYIDQALPDHLQCILEYSDELWNFGVGFSDGFNFCSGMFDPPIVGADTQAASAAGYRSAQVMAIAKRVSGYSSRFLPFFGSQGNRANVARDVVTGIRAAIADWSDPTNTTGKRNATNALPAKGAVYDADFAARFKEVGQIYAGFGGAFYLEIISDHLSAAGKQEVLSWGNDADGGAAKIIDQLRHGKRLVGNLLADPNQVQICVDNIGDLYAEQIVVSHEIQVPIWGYEGGPCFELPFDPAFVTITRAARRSPAWQQLTADWLTAFLVAAKYELLTGFTDIGSGDNTFGALESPYALTTPQYLGYKAIQDNPPAAAPLTVSVATLGQAKVGFDPTDRLTISGGVTPYDITFDGLRPERVFDGFRSVNGVIAQEFAGPVTVTVDSADGQTATFTYQQVFQPASAPTVGVTLVGGETAATRLFRVTDDATTLAQLGITPAPGTSVFATYYDPGVADNYTPVIDQIVEQAPSETGQYKSAGAATFLNLKRAFSGRPWRLVGAPVGATDIHSWAPGSPLLNDLLNVLKRSGGRADEVVWMLGQTDATRPTSYADFRSGLDASLGEIKKASSVTPKIIIASIGFLGNSVGSNDAILTIRRAARDWCADNGATYIEPQDLATSDFVRPNQRGAMILATAAARATRPLYGLAGDDTGPSLASVTRANGKLVLTFTLPAGATKMVVGGYALANRLRVYPQGTVANAVAVDWQHAVVSGATITLTDPAPSQAIDVWLDYDYQLGSGPYADGDVNSVRDDHVEADEKALGITFGRALRPTLAPVGAAAIVAAAPTPAPAPAATTLPVGLVNRLMTWDMPAQADGSALASATDSAGGVFTTAHGSPKYRTGGAGGKPYVQVTDGDLMILPTANGGAGGDLKALIESGTFTAIAFVEQVGNGGRTIGAVMGSYADPGSFMLNANGQRAGFYYDTESCAFSFPWTGAGMLSIAQVSNAAYPFQQAGQTEALNRLYLGGGCIYGSTGQKIKVGPEGLGLFGISNNYDQGYFSGRYYGHLFFNRALSPAEMKQVQRWFCEQTSQPMPWAGLNATYGAFGNSLDDGYGTAALEYTPMALAAAAMGLPLGAWDNLGVNGQNTNGMKTTIASLKSTSAVTGITHKLLLGEYYNSTFGPNGITPQQTANNIGDIIASFRAVDSKAKLFVQTPTNTQSDVNDGHAKYDAFIAALLALPADGVVRLDQDPHIGRTGDVTDATYYQGDELHLTGRAAACGSGVKASAIVAAFTA